MALDLDLYHDFPTADQSHYTKINTNADEICL